MLISRFTFALPNLSPAEISVESLAPNVRESSLAVEDEIPTVTVDLIKPVLDAIAFHYPTANSVLAE